MKAPAALAGAITGAKLTTYAHQDSIALDAIKASYLDIYRAYLDLKPTGGGGKRYKACCPSHDDRHPSLIIFENGRFWCPVCDISGDVFDFIERKDGATFPEAKRTAAALIGVTLDRALPAEARRMAEARRQSRERAAELIEWRDKLILALRDARNNAWDDANQYDRATWGLPATEQVRDIRAEAHRRRRNGDAIDKYIDKLTKLNGDELADLRSQLEREAIPERRAA